MSYFLVLSRLFVHPCMRIKKPKFSTKLPEATVPKVGRGPKMAKNEIWLCFCGFPIYSSRVLQPIHVEPMEWDVEVLACFRPVFFFCYFSPTVTFYSFPDFFFTFVCRVYINRLIMFSGTKQRYFRKVTEDFLSRSRPKISCFPTRVFKRVFGLWGLSSWLPAHSTKVPTQLQTALELPTRRIGHFWEMPLSPSGEEIRACRVRQVKQEFCVIDIQNQYRSSKSVYQIVTILHDWQASSALEKKIDN